MRKVIDALHDIWCAITKSCRVQVGDDPYIEWMRGQERDAITETHKTRQRRMNLIEQQYLGGSHDR